MNGRILRLATRASPLALWQARQVASLLRFHHPGLTVRLVPVTSTGDTDRSTPLYGMGGIGVFAKEVHDRILANEADAGVHSCKDLPTTAPEGVILAAVLRRADPRDVLIGANALAALPKGARIGTSSLRRMAQLRLQRPDLTFVNLRGNVATRLRKLAEGEADATILAAAGLARLGLLRAAKAVPLDPEQEMVPAAAQGAVAVDCRARDARTRRLIACLTHPDSWRAVISERKVLAGLRGGCSLPLGIFVRRQADGRWRAAAYLDRDGQEPRRCALEGSLDGLAERVLAAM